MANTLTYKGLNLLAAPYQPVSVEGLVGGTEVRTNDRPYVARDGMRAGTDRTEGRTVTIQLDVFADNDASFSTALTNITAAFEPADPEPSPLGITLPGVAGGNAVILNLRARRLSAPLPIGALGARYARVTAELYAADPLKYSDPPAGTLLSPNPSAGGFVWPFTWPLTWPGAGSGSQTVVYNAGTAYTYPVVTLTGPLTNPAITNLNNGRSVALALTLNAGEELVLDFGDRSAVIGGTVNRYPYLSRAEWFTLEPGNNGIVLLADSGTGTAFVEWRNAWQ